MGLFDNIRSYLVTTGQDVETVDTEESKDILFGERGASGTANASGYLFPDFNNKFNGRQAANVYDEMRKTDGTIRAVLEAVKLPIISAQWSVQPGVEDDAKATEIAEFVQENLFETLEGGFKARLREALGYVDFGYYLFEKVFEIKDNKIMIKKLAARHPTSIDAWIMRSNPETPGITQQLPTVTPEEARKGRTTMTPEIPMWKLMRFTNDQEGDNWAGVSILRSGYIHWFMKNTLYRLDGIKHERGAGILKIQLPDSSSAQDRTSAAALGKNFKINESAYIVVPNSEWNIELMTAGIADQSAALMKSAEHHDTLLAKSVLAQFLQLGSGTTGSFALSKDQSSFFLLSLRARADYIASVFNEQLIKELVILNYGEQENYPKLTFTGIEQIDVDKMSQVLERLMNTGLLSNSANIQSWVRDAFQLPQMTPEEAAEEADEEVTEDSAVDNSDEEQETELSEAHLHDHDCASHLCLSEEDLKKKFVPFRKMTFAEKRVKFDVLKAFFAEEEETLKTKLERLTTEQESKVMAQAKKALDTGDVSAVSKIRVPAVGTMKKELKQEAKRSYEEGKRTAANEMGVSLPTTPSLDARLMNARIDQAVDDRSGAIEAAVKTGVLELMGKGVGTTAALFELRKKFDTVANRANSQIVGRVVANNLNAGRSLVYTKNTGQVAALQRSELLDSRTCAMCMSIDGRVIEKDDPFGQVGQIHTNCRGVWVTVLKSDAEQPTPKPIPKSILNRFDRVDGVPVANAFRQPKKPIVTKDSRVQERIDDGRLKNNPNV